MKSFVVAGVVGAFALASCDAEIGGQEEVSEVIQTEVGPRQLAMPRVSVEAYRDICVNGNDPISRGYEVMGEIGDEPIYMHPEYVITVAPVNYSIGDRCSLVLTTSEEVDIFRDAFLDAKVELREMVGIYPPYLSIRVVPE